MKEITTEAVSITLSRHEERLKKALAIQSKAWKTGNSRGLPIVFLVADALLLASDLGFNAETIIRRAKAEVRRRKKR